MDGWHGDFNFSVSTLFVLISVWAYNGGFNFNVFVTFVLISMWAGNGGLNLNVRHQWWFEFQCTPPMVVLISIYAYNVG